MSLGESRLCVLAGAITLAVMSVPASAQEIYDGSPPTTGTNSHEVITTLVNGTECRLTTFENGGNLEAIHPELNNSIAGSGMRFPGWKTLTSGFFSNNPSGVTIAFMDAPSREITFDGPVSTVSFFYASGPPVTVDAFDAAGNVVATVTEPGNADASFNVWDPIGVDVSANIITRITVTGSTTSDTAIDDPTNCRIAGTPADLLGNLILDVIILDLMTGISTNLDAKLDRALDALDDLNANNDVAAVNSLNAFINAVIAQSGHAIPVEDADILIEQAFAILELLEG